MDDAFCPNIDDLSMTPEDQFVLDSMALITDEELIDMGLWSFQRILWFVECNHREEIMRRMDSSADKIFTLRRFRRERKIEERLKEEAIERLRSEELSRIRELQRVGNEQKQKKTRILDIIHRWSIYPEKALLK